MYSTLILLILNKKTKAESHFVTVQGFKHNFVLNCNYIEKYCIFKVTLALLYKCIIKVNVNERT